MEKVCGKIGDPVQKATIRWVVICMLTAIGIVWGISATVYSNAQKKDDAALTERMKLIDKNENLAKENRELIGELKIQNANMASWMTYISKQLEEISLELKEHRQKTQTN